MTIPKVAIGFPYYKHWEGRMGLCAFEFAARSAQSCAMLAIECTGAYVEDNRNGIVKFALNTEIPFDYLMWIDTDMIFPADTMIRLLGHDRDIVGANYRQRRPPYSFVGHYLDGLDTHLHEPGLHPMAHLGTGLLLTKFDIYRKMPYPWFDAGLVTQRARDDVYFCNRARELGYEVWCDHDLTFQVRHIGDQEIPWIPEEQVVKVRGAEIDLELADRMGKDRAAQSSQQYKDFVAAGGEGKYREIGSKPNGLGDIVGPP